MTTAYFLLNVAINHEAEVIDEVKQILNKQSLINFEIQGVYGIYDIIIKITADSDHKNRNLALEKIKSIKTIQSAITMMVNDN